MKRPRGSLLRFRDEYEYSIIGTYSVSKLVEEVPGESASSSARHRHREQPAGVSRRLVTRLV